jgi:hypothetical protein
MIHASEAMTEWWLESEIRRNSEKNWLLQLQQSTDSQSWYKFSGSIKARINCQHFKKPSTFGYVIYRPNRLNINIIIIIIKLLETSLYVVRLVLLSVPPRTLNSLIETKLAVAHLVKTFSVFYEARRFIAMFIKACRWSLSTARWIQSTPSCSVPLKFFPTLSQ